MKLTFVSSLCIGISLLVCPSIVLGSGIATGDPWPIWTGSLGILAAITTAIVFNQVARTRDILTEHVAWQRQIIDHQNRELLDLIKKKD